jgi:hypothetical protein
MTAGMAATSPAAVRDERVRDVRADGLDRRLSGHADLFWNASRMPTTVPKSPMKGAVEPVVARNGVSELEGPCARRWRPCGASA